MPSDILNKYINNEKSVNFTNYSLDGIATLLSHFKNPHKNFKSLHISGTNGKGSTAFMLSSVLEKSGYKTGLYISPHLVKINERIKINSIDIDDNTLNKYVMIINDIVLSDSSLNPTFFDILTTAAFIYFSDQKVDIAVIETGLGGRLDSTNVLTPELSIITDISLDHVNILGAKIESIVKEKCGIIKPDIAVVTSNSESGIVDIIKKFAENNKSELLSYGYNFFTENIKWENEVFKFDYLSSDYEMKQIELSLFPVHQIKNAAMVITSLLYLKSMGFSKISEEIIYSVLKNIVVPGRFQILNFKPLIIYDPAHNFEALNNLLSGVDTYYPLKNKKIIISLMADKADVRTLNLFKDYDTFYYPLSDPRAFIPGINQFQSIIYDDRIISKIIRDADDEDDMIIFTGTFRIYSFAMSITNLSLRNI